MALNLCLRLFTYLWHSYCHRHVGYHMSAIMYDSYEVETQKHGTEHTPAVTSTPPGPCCTIGQGAPCSHSPRPQAAATPWGGRSTLGVQSPPCLMHRTTHRRAQRWGAKESRRTAQCRRSRRWIRGGRPKMHHHGIKQAPWPLGAGIWRRPLRRHEMLTFCASGMNPRTCPR